MRSESGLCAVPTPINVRKEDAHFGVRRFPLAYVRYLPYNLRSIALAMWTVDLAAVTSYVKRVPSRGALSRLPLLRSFAGHMVRSQDQYRDNSEYST